MWTRHFNGLVVLGVIGTVSFTTGCNERQQQSVNENARQVGQEVGEAAKDVQHGAGKAAESLRESSREAADGFREGVGGSGDTASEEQKADERSGDGPDIGRNPGVIHDGEGPLEER
ncbi:hypothetical protein JYK02_07940 [Corallococcus macrosporus]|uniref:Latency associated antigen n=1 Tax=Corallococcus macrosporus TaxID=35 RepID=A0ABS3D6Y5_9BACT|nr:hypothetical protein [Corallococcus macrosporus]MBN8227436.1 hypothetical protein [Corallococcus macrosporus]